MHSGLLEFDYKFLSNRWMPMVPLVLGYREQHLKVEAYVDSGAFYSIFAPEVAQALGVPFKEGKRMMFIAGDGKPIISWIVKLPVQLGFHSFIADIAFSEDLKIGFNLLGRKGIFEQFSEVIFQEKRRKILFRI